MIDGVEVNGLATRKKKRLKKNKIVRFMRRLVLILVCLVATAILLHGCTTRVGTPAGKIEAPGHKRSGDEIVVAGQMFHTGTRVVLWSDPGGMNGYAPPPKPIPASAAPLPGFQFGKRSVPPPPGSATTRPTELENADLPTLRNVVDQFVLHYDGSGVSERCFSTLQRRGLSVHFMLDLDGTIYQAVDLRERTFHATTSNSRSIGVEIANIGAFPIAAAAPQMSQWYVSDSAEEGGLKRIVVPSRPEYPAPKWRDPNFIPRPARNAIINGVIQREALKQYDFTHEQYVALAKLTATLSRVFPKIACDYPRDSSGRLNSEKLDTAELAKFQGVLGHFHIQANKNDPGPAMQWERLMRDARAHLSR